MKSNPTEACVQRAQRSGTRAFCSEYEGADHMPKVEIYTKKNCSYCVRAKQLLDHKKVKYTEIPVDQDPKELEMMLFRAEGRRTVPQIFINDQGIGGCDDLYALDNAGKLDNLLK